MLSFKKNYNNKNNKKYIIIQKFWFCNKFKLGINFNKKKY